MNVNLWSNAEHALAYLAERDTIPHRAEGYGVLAEMLPPAADRVLDLGCGDGDALAVVIGAYPGAHGVGLDFGAEMLRRATDRFAGDDRVSIAHHDLSEPLPELGDFDVIVSSFAIHHLAPTRQQALYGEVFGRLRPGGVFMNLEHVASSTDALHDEFQAAIGRDDDPSNQLVAVPDHLRWLRDWGFADADCMWKWRELALLRGLRPA